MDTSDGGRFWPEKKYWLSSNRMTVEVIVDFDGKICKAAPIARKFTGQPLENLVRWMENQTGFRMEEIK